jgi:hypothetical protein
LDSSFGELDALRFAARQGGRLLADLNVAQADALERLQLVAHCRHGGKKSTPSSTVMSSTSAIDLPLK